MYKINSILFILTALLFINNGYAQCDGGTAIAAQPTVCSGSSNTITVSVPSGTVQWQESSDGTNWFDVTQGSTSTNTTSNTISTTFSYTGSPQNFIVPNGVTTINADGMGAAGGHGSSDFNGRGGLGGRLISDIATTPGETLSVTIGEKGHNTTVNPGTGQQANNLWVAGDALGGFNGGGNGSNGSGGGGGATDIRQGGNALSNRIFVVGSGGGGGNQRRNTEAGGNGGNGGGNTAANGTNGAAGGAGGGGGSQVAGGSSSGNNGATNGSQGQGGTGATSGRQGGGGGGGYYGGGGGGFVNDKAGGGGGGGSSYSSGSITTNTQGNSSASGNGTLSLTYTMPVVTSVYTTPGLTSSTYYRAVVTDGLCNDISTTETVLITPDNTATLSSAVATTSQTINLGASLTSITYTTAGATGATFSGLPSGVSGAWNANMITISGVPTVAGTFNYTATLTGGCGTISASGSIKILNNPNLNNFSAEVKTFFDQSYTITPPATSGSGTITYTSSDLAVATISGTTVTIVGAGTTTITATQVSDGIYYSDSISANLTVNNVTALTKNGKESNSDLNYINKNGAMKTDTTLTKHGEIIPAKSQ